MKPLQKNQFIIHRNPNRIEIKINNENVIEIPVLETQKLVSANFDFMTISYTKVCYSDVKKFIDCNFDNFHYVYKSHSDVITRSRCRAYCIENNFVYFITFGFVPNRITETKSTYGRLNVFNKWVRSKSKHDLNTIASNENWHWLL